MKTEPLCVFCLLVCCELSVVFTRVHHRTFVHPSHSRQVRTDRLRATSEHSDDELVESTGLSGTIKTIPSIPENDDVNRGPPRRKHAHDKHSQTKSFQVHDKSVRQKRETANKTRNEQNGSRDIESSEDKRQASPKASAQVQPTNFPDDPTILPERDISPAGDYEEPYTPLGPFDTRSRTPGVKNPFYPVTGDSYGAYAVVCISVVIFTVGIIGNIVIMCIVCHNYYLRSISNSLLANLALWDFVNLFFCLPLVVFHELTKDWLLGEFSCKIIPYIEVASLGVTTFTLCALCIDRFRAASNIQMYYEMIENCASTTAKLTVIWLGALLLALPELLIWQLVREEREPPEVTPCEHCVVRISTSLPDTLYVLGLTYNSARLWWYFGCYFCLPTVFTIISSVASARKISKAERASVRGNRKQIQLESQMNCTVVALAIVYGFCVIPENISNIVSVYMATSVPRRTLDILHLVSQVMLFCKSAVTPVLLLVLCRPFSKAFLDCCCCCLEECGPPKSSDATSDEHDQDGTTVLELSPYSTVCREPSTFTTVGTHC